MKKSIPTAELNDGEAEREFKLIARGLPTNSPIFLPTERLPPAARLAGIRRVKALYDGEYAARHQPALRALRNEFKGRQRCFVIGNGPSLNRTDLGALRDEVTFAVNGFFLKSRELDWAPTFYVVEDHLVAEDRREWINAFKGPRKLFPIYLAYCLAADEDTIFFNHRPRKSFPHGFDFSTDASELTYAGCTVTFTCLQLAFYLGFSEIYLVGVDADYELPKDVEHDKAYGVGVLDMKSDDKNHFHPDYFGKGFRWHDPQVDKMVLAYQEARRVIEAEGKSIFNATVGGRLEVFERRHFGEIFPDARPAEALEGQANADALAPRDDALPVQAIVEHLPRLLLIDFTKPGDGSATGQVKAALFDLWPREKLLSLHMEGNSLQLGGGAAGLDCQRGLDAAIQHFAPQLVLYRPVPNRHELHAFAMHFLRRAEVPFVVWVMDDWPRQLEVEDPAQFAFLDGDWRELVGSAARRYSIGTAMSVEFEARYGCPFAPFSNGVTPAEWPRPSPRPPRTFTLRYAGSLAENMTLHSVARIAEAVDRLSAEGADIAFEINTRPLWVAQAKQLVAGHKGVSIGTQERSVEEYRQWLVEADMVVIAYNFDEASMRYTRYSVANKLPECLASGAVVLGHGPTAQATIALLDEADCAVVVAEPEVDALVGAIRDMMASPFKRLDLAQKSQAYAFRHCRLIDKQIAFMHELTEAAREPIRKPGYSREQEAHVDETAVVAHLLSHARGAGQVMLDVGAHFGTSARYFHQLGWRVYCFEPDASNRAKLEARFGGQPLVHIDPRGISDVAETGRSFFSSPESTGVSGLNPFLASHEESGRIDITTVAAVVDEFSLTKIDFLKVDVEGFELKVLHGVPWERLRPAVIECEFEDAKTRQLGYCCKDLADSLIAWGYTVYVSEWHPIVRYGVRHQWRRVTRYPDAEIPKEAWGNLLAFLADPGLPAVIEAFDKCLSKKDWRPPPTPIKATAAASERSFPMSQASGISTRLALWAESNSPLLLRLGRSGKEVIRRVGPVTRRYVDRRVDQLAHKLTAAVGKTSETQRRQQEQLRTLEQQLLASQRQVQSLADELARWPAKTSEESRSGGPQPFQPFSRRLEAASKARLRSVWGERLGLTLSDQMLRYMAHRVVVTETVCIGRLATSVETVLLRTLVAMAVQGTSLRVLEIGTLFGLGTAVLQDIARGNFEEIHLSVVDPFDGYYGAQRADIVTGQAVTERQFRRNMKLVGIESGELSVIVGYSQDEKSIEAAQARRYNCLIIDGDHSGEGVLRDFNLYRPMVESGGFIIFDDYDSPHWPEIKPAVDAHVMPLADLEFVGADFSTAVFRVR